MFAATKVCKRLGCTTRWYCTKSDDHISIMKTKYPTDSWTNIKPQFLPFVGSNIFKRANPFKQQTHPLTLTQREIIAYLGQWFVENDAAKLKIYHNLDPVEPNPSPVRQPNTFYVNQALKLRTDLFDREMRYLKDGRANFAIVTDLYRQCVMDATHFPVFHRINVVRTLQPDATGTAVDAGERLEYEQKTLVETIVKRLFDDDVRFRWIEANSAPVKPYRILEIWHNEQWLKVSGAGLIESKHLQSVAANGTMGWEVSIGLDRLVMAMFKIFDIRLLWTNDAKYLNQFVPKPMAAKIEGTAATIERKKAKAWPIPASAIVETKKPKNVQQVSYFLPKGVPHEAFPMEQLCEAFKKLGNGRILDVGIRRHHDS